MQIEAYYNGIRLHSSIGCSTPVAIEARRAERAKVAIVVALDLPIELWQPQHIVIMATSPLFIFETAEGFYQAYELLGKLRYQDQRVLSAHFTNAALACELYLKCILVIENGDCPKIHSLKTLFQRLRKDTQIAIRTTHDNQSAIDNGHALWRAQGMMTDLDSLLDSGHDAFTVTRYVFEESMRKDFAFYPDIFVWTLRQHIFQTFPQWFLARPWLIPNELE
jgi:hypothetical protein